MNLLIKQLNFPRGREEGGGEKKNRNLSIPRSPDISNSKSNTKLQQDGMNSIEVDQIEATQNNHSSSKQNQKKQNKTHNKRKKGNLQDTVTIASIAEILETKVSLSFRKLISEGFFQLRSGRPHFLRA